MANREREKQSSGGLISLSTEEREGLWDEACFEYGCDGVSSHSAPEYFHIRIRFASSVAAVLIQKSNRREFTLSEMERLFGVPLWRQKSLIEKGLSPARMKGRKIEYDGLGAMTVLTLEELNNFYSFKNILFSFGKKLADDNFVYWAIRRKNLGKIYPQTIKISSN